jgi:hypothetical protein
MGVTALSGAVTAQGSWMIHMPVIQDGSCHGQWRATGGRARWPGGRGIRVSGSASAPENHQFTEDARLKM